MKRDHQHDLRRAGLGWALAAGALLVQSCGGGSAEHAPAKAGVHVAKVEAGPEQKAQERFVALSKEVDKLESGQEVNRGWLAKELQAVLKLNPEHDAAEFDLAVLKELGGDKDAARKMYEEIHERNPSFAPAAENLAAYLVREGHQQEAVATYRRIIEKDPKNVTSRLALARLLATEKQYDEAVKLCRGALQQKADAIEAFRVLALAYDAIGNTPMAELIIGRGRKVDENDVELNYLLAEILLKKKDLASGVRQLKEVVKLDPNKLAVRAQLADIALSYRDFGNAAQQYEAILKEKPKHRGALIGLAVAYKGMGRYDQADKIYTQLLTAKPDDVDAMWNEAVLYHHHLNRYDDAISLYKRFKEAAGPGDEKAKEVDKLVSEIEKQKSDLAAAKAREERERKKAEAIKAACAAVKEGKKPNAEAIGTEQERTETGWQLMVDAQAAIQGGDVAAGEQMVQCAFAIIPDSPGAKIEACAPMRNMWTQILYQLNRIDEALANTRAALACDPNNPDAQLIEQQLMELIKQQKEAAAAEGGAAAGGAAPAAADAAAQQPPKPAKGK